MNNLVKATNLSRKKFKHFLHNEPAYTEYRSVIRKTPRIRVIINDIEEIWPLDLAYVDKLAKYNDDVEYLLVAVDCMSRYLRVQALKSKNATTTAKVFKLMITTKQPKNVWVDKGTEFKQKGIKHLAQRATKSLQSLREIFVPRKILYIRTWRINGLTHTLTNCKFLSTQLIQEQIVCQILHQTK